MSKTSQSMMPQKGSSFSGALRRRRRRGLIHWVRFVEKHKNSKWLPIFFFLALVIHGYLPAIPVFLMIMLVVAIDGDRWLWYWFLSALAETVNNASTYLLGRLLPPHVLESVIRTLHWNGLWKFAHHEIERHGIYAAFIGALAGLPNPPITALIGLADAENVRLHTQIEHSWWKVFILVFVGYMIRNGVVAAGSRFGFLRFKRRF